MTKFSRDYKRDLEGHYSILGDSKEDCSVYRVVNGDVTYYEAEVRGYPLVWHGYSFGSIVHQGWGTTISESLTDLLKGLRSLMNRQANPVTIKEGNGLQREMPAVPVEVPEEESPEAS